MTQSVASQIADMGTALGPDVLSRCKALFDREQLAFVDTVPAIATDLAYGSHERHRLDIYGAGEGTSRPVIIFVHGGGFLKGDKGSAGHWPNAAVGRMAAGRGFLGVVINYRLAHDHMWPAGSEDVDTAVKWLKAHIAEYGGDPERIVLVGTSAGAVHIAGYLKLVTDVEPEIRGAVLLSGLYGYTPLDDRDTLYYGDHALYAERMPRAAVAQTELPLFIACAEHDPARFQAEFLGLMKDRLERNGAMPRGYIASGHNHYSMAMHLGTSDTRLADEIVGFVETVTTPKLGQVTQNG
jgi:acetyl esterase/lipase